MSMTVTLSCNKCGFIKTYPISQGRDESKVKVKDFPRFYSFFDMPESKHFCFECAFDAINQTDKG